MTLSSRDPDGELDRGEVCEEGLMGLSPNPARYVPLGALGRDGRYRSYLVIALDGVQPSGASTKGMVSAVLLTPFRGAPECGA